MNPAAANRAAARAGESIGSVWKEARAPQCCNRGVDARRQTKAWSGAKRSGLQLV